MVNVDDILTEADLARVLALGGYASESPWLDRSWREVRALHDLSPARHLTGDKYKSLFVAVKGGAIQVYWWIVLACEVRGQVPEEQLSEKIELAALPDKAPRDPDRCICLDLPLPFAHYEDVKFIGVDKTLGRFGEVTSKVCRHCGRHWLHYFVEYEAFSRSGRYFMGLVTPERAESITPTTAVDYIASLDWHLYGGSYFEGKGRSTTKHIQVDC